MDFIADLPKSEGQDTIWVFVDRFSKIAHFVPLSGLPSVDTLATIFVQHVVKLHGISENNVSDRGFKFVARSWKALCANMGITLNFSTT